MSCSWIFSDFANGYVQPLEFPPKVNMEAQNARIMDFLLHMGRDRGGTGRILRNDVGFRGTGGLMTAIHQLSPPIYVNTPKGEGDTLFLIDYGVNINTVWVVHLHESGEVLHFDSSDVRIMGNLMYGIGHPAPPK